jgi:tetratricopeptide (TPR) repeat protein
VVTCKQIVAETEQNLDVLSTTRRDVPERHRSLRAVFEHSWQLLSDDDQRIFSCLSIFRGGFTLEAAREVAGANVHTVRRLISQSLLRVTIGEDGEAPRYEIHETVRQYAEEKLAREPKLLREMETAHIAYYVDLLRRQNEAWHGGAQQVAIDAISKELDNVRLAWQRAVAHGDVQAIDRATTFMHRFYYVRGWYQEGSELFALAVARLQAQESPDAQSAWGHLSVCQSWFRGIQGKPAEAWTLAQQGVEVLRRHEEGEPLAFALNTLGVMHLNAGSYHRARAVLRDSLDIYRALDQKGSCFAPLVNLGTACLHTGDYATAQEAFEEGLALCREHGDSYGVAKFFTNLGMLHGAMGDWSTAGRYFEQALGIGDEVGLLHFRAGTLGRLSQAYTRQGQFEQALANGKAGIEFLHQCGDIQSVADGLVWQGLAHHGLGDRDAAYRCICEGLEIALRIQVDPVTLSLLVGGAVLLLGGDRHKMGIDLLEIAARHPATEWNYRTYALELLSEQGITLPDDEANGESYEETRSLAEVASSLLTELRMVLQANDGDLESSEGGSGEPAQAYLDRI